MDLPDWVTGWLAILRLQIRLNGVILGEATMHACTSAKQMDYPRCIELTRVGPSGHVSLPLAEAAARNAGCTCLVAVHGCACAKEESGAFRHF